MDLGSKIKNIRYNNNVSQEVLQRASELGTATHKAIEDYCSKDNYYCNGNSLR